MKIILKIADPTGHKQQTITVAKAKRDWPFTKGKVVGLVALDGVVLDNAKQLSKELNRLVNEKREEVVIDVIPRIAGGSQ